ncbi:MAG: galactose-1-phosphate uridylyltransferase [Actinomycetales bacterium]
MTHAIKRTAARLADGREIIYFDEDGTSAERILVDPRDLPPVRQGSELRYDALLDEWVAIASHRQGRTFLPPADECPLCPSSNGRQTEVPSPAYDVVVFQNRFPSFSEDAPAVPEFVDPDSPGPRLATRRPSYGRCEVVLFTSDHESSFSELTPARVRTVLTAWADRTEHLSALPHVEQVFCFENRGQEIGVTLHHPHGQIYAYPYVTPRSEQMLRSARTYLERTGGNLFADVLAAERAAKRRVVVESDHWTAFVPAAARWPFEVHLYPHRQVPDLPALDAAERADFSRVYLDVLRRLDALFDAPLPYIAGWHQAPVHRDRDLAYLHLELFSIRRAPGKLKYLAGSESAMGAFVNDITPERSAEMLRAVSIDDSDLRADELATSR